MIYLAIEITGAVQYIARIKNAEIIIAQSVESVLSHCEGVTPLFDGVSVDDIEIDRSGPNERAVR